MTDAEIGEALELAQAAVQSPFIDKTSELLARALLALHQRLQLAEDVCEGVAMYATIETNEKLLMLHHKWRVGRESRGSE
ncbi:MAG: hypothetical protein E6R04_04895 [Spirochaetes bacterium]|nr:MAG: hypothetical protein E6R04_04895 [Spirochaetota bacterium]